MQGEGLGPDVDDLASRPLGHSVHILRRYVNLAHGEGGDGFLQRGLVLLHLSQALVVEPEVERVAAAELEEEFVAAGAFVHVGGALVE